MDQTLWLALSAQIFSLFVGIISYKKNSVSVSGLIALLVVSSLFIWLNKIALLFVLFYMFASSSYLSYYKKSQKKDFEEVVAKNGPRDYIQAISNLGVATLLVIIYHFIKEDWLIAAIVGSVAAANADSWASEIGGISKKQPVLITNFKPVPKGISGGITLAGTLGGIAGSIFIVLSSIVTMHFMDPFLGSSYLLIGTSLIAGISGFILDSYLGALFQSLYKNTTNQQLTENPDGNKELIKGFNWVNNDMVNFITTAAGALVAGILYWIIS